MNVENNIVCLVLLEHAVSAVAMAIVSALVKLLNFL